MSHVFNNANVLITGGLGFIGSTLAHRLHGMGARVTVVDNLMPQYGGSRFNVAAIADDLEIHINDVRDVKAMETLIEDKQFIFNLAGQSSHMDSMTDPFTDLEINCHAQLAILELCRRVNPDVILVFASTRQIYGKPDYLPVDEKHLLRPVDVNGINKMAGEWYHILYNNVYGIRSCALRLTNTIGPRMRVKDARQTFLGVWIKQLVEGKPFDVWGGDQLRDFTFGEDAVDAFLAAAAHDQAYGKIFNLGGNRVVSLKELAELLLEANQGGSFTVKPFPSDRKKIDIGDFYADNSLITDTLGWVPKTPLARALKDTLDYYRHHLENYL